MTTLNEHTRVLAAILSDISDHSDMNFIDIQFANKCQQQIRKNDRKNTLKQTKHQTKSQFAYIHISYVTKAAEIGVFFWSQKMSALMWTNRLVQYRFQKSGSIQELSLTKLAPDLLIYLRPTVPLSSDQLLWHSGYMYLPGSVEIRPIVLEISRRKAFPWPISTWCDIQLWTPEN